MEGRNSLVLLTQSRATGARVRKTIAIVLLATGLAGCGAVDALVDGFKHAKAVETDLAQTTGVRPTVGFNWNNGRLTTVTVTFPKLLEDKPLRELAEAARAAVGKEFKQRADNVVLSFSLGPTATTTAQVERSHATN
ncbi:hypothetical protein ACH79_12470 [Bradyrhizobium sp. CCBAU 051011]|uniref:hypothetical protein n=1 Tax=Bradyrhizobium sp. CCBAU 051011 TaxID=858422 RepID=UPI001374606B|nr:hypothetical protein [Bradyrhizobium sp. CCBAU 051011]QHO73345.1 hypothetical protein ACH79_12470 [Bradyrhizobium sp. CCBAU 051011]